MSGDRNDPGAGAEAATAEPGDKVGELQQLLAQEQAKRQAAELSIQQAQAEIAALGQVADDLDKIADDYAKELPAINAAKEKAGNYETDETKCLENILGEAKAAVKTTVDALVKPKNDLKREIKNDEKALATLKGTRDTKAEAQKKAKEAFEALKKIAADIKARLTELDAIARDVKTEHDANKYAVAYWLLVYRFSGKLGGLPKIQTKDELAAALKAARDKYVTAIAEFYTADTAVKAAEKALEAKKARLADLQKGLDANIRAELSKIMPQRQAA